ncbi:hypothetical protein [Nonomuraea insulae]|uniref:Aminoglycoside phosphotransferase domain-containing protein n=1 Tax=Nonomuraea insulae TaxID=1616787 RepID=A0ABW1DA77_9ACTN
MLGVGDQAGEGAAGTGVGEQSAQQALHLPQFAWLHGDFHTGNLLT